MTKHAEQLILAENFKNQETKKKYEIAQKIGTVKGFYQHYFDLLPKMQGREKTFNEVNDLYYNIFNEYKYTDYNSFRSALGHHLKNKQK